MEELWKWRSDSLPTLTAGPPSSTTGVARRCFAYQIAFVRHFDRFPQQPSFELFEELVCFSAAQLGLDAGLIDLYRKREPHRVGQRRALRSVYPSIGSSSAGTVAP
jgi:hypothetical protein